VTPKRPDSGPVLIWTSGVAVPEREVDLDAARAYSRGEGFAALTGHSACGPRRPRRWFDLPPMRFMATASVYAASVEMTSDIAPVAKRLTISAAARLPPGNGL